MEVRCPHCHSPIDLADDTPLSDIARPSCGGSFSLLGEETVCLKCLEKEPRKRYTSAGEAREETRRHLHVPDMTVAFQTWEAALFGTSLGHDLTTVDPGSNLHLSGGIHCVVEGR
jgi:hypothetical protein